MAQNPRFDDKGLFVCLCRHGIPVFLVNMDTPGEQQKYVISVLKKLFSMLPPTATVVLLYDIACIIERSVQKVSFAHDNVFLGDDHLYISIPFFLTVFPLASGLRRPPCTRMAISGPARSSITRGSRLE
jgi:hypothetical protein